jgi:hypothetical protein
MCVSNLDNTQKLIEDFVAKIKTTKLKEIVVS